MCVCVCAGFASALMPACGGNCNANIINKCSFINFAALPRHHWETTDACERVNLGALATGGYSLTR